MPLEFELSHDQAGDNTVDADHVVNQLQQMGYNPQGLSPDGLMVTLQDQQGPYQIPTAQALQNLGWKVNNVKPANADYSNVQSGWRAAITALPDDDMRRAYIEGQFRKMGHQQTPQIMGQGRDWYAFNPGTSQWVAVTNNPEWDRSDAAEALVHAPRVIGSSLGVLGGIPGVVAGGTGGDIATRLALAAIDPTYKQVATASAGNMGAMAKDIGINTLVDAGTMGLAKGGGALLNRFASAGTNQAVRAMATAGPISTAARAAGAGAEVAGGLTKVVGNAADSQIGRQVMAYMNPLTSGPMMTAEMAQLPGQATRGLAHLPGFLAEQPWVQKMVGAERAEGMRDLTGMLTKSRASSRNGAEELAARFGRPAPAYEPGSREVVANTVEDLAARRAGGSYTTARDAAYKEARMYGMNATDAYKNVAEEAGNEAFDASMAASKPYQAAGEHVGNIIDHLERAGRGAENFMTGAHGFAAKGLKGAGVGMQYGGRGLNRAATVAQPIEAYNWGRLGSEELYGQHLRDQQQAWRPQGNRARMSEEILAYNR